MVSWGVKELSIDNGEKHNDVLINTTLLFLMPMTLPTIIRIVITIDY